MPSTAALVKEAIGNTRAFAMDVAAACSGFVYAWSAGQAYIASGMARNVLVIGAELLTRFLDYSDRNTCILFGDGAGAVVLSAAEEPGGGLGIELTTEPQGAYMIWLPAGGVEEPALGGDRRPRRALHPDGGPGDLPVRDPDARQHRPRRGRARPASSRRTSTCSSRTRPTSGSSRRSPTASACRWTGCS